MKYPKYYANYEQQEIMLVVNPTACYRRDITCLMFIKSFKHEDDLEDWGFVEVDRDTADKVLTNKV